MFLWQSGYGPSASCLAPRLPTSWQTLPVCESWEAEPALTHFGNQRGADRPSPAWAAGLWAHKPSGPEGVFAQDFIFYINM